MLKIVAACGNGMGSSQMIKMKITQVFQALKVSADVQHMAIADARDQVAKFDVVICSEALTSQFPQSGRTKIIGLKNLLSTQEIETKIRAAGLIK